jgi:site-specific DNA-methyltransferase (adenine-specific)
MNAKVMPLKSHENILVFYRKKPVYNPQMTLSTPYTGFSSETAKIGEVYGSAKSKHRANPEGTRYPKTVLKFAQERLGLHPTGKPVPLMEYLILTYTNPGETVLDNCMGSGTTGVAAYNTGRNFIGVEKDEKYYETAKNRIEALYD